MLRCNSVQRKMCNCPGRKCRAKSSCDCDDSFSAGYMRDIITNSFCHILNRTRRHMCETCRWASSATPNSPRRVIPPALRVNIAVTIVSDSELFATALVLYNWKEDTATPQRLYRHELLLPQQTESWTPQRRDPEDCRCLNSWRQGRRSAV